MTDIVMPSKAQLAAGFDLGRLLHRADFRDWLRTTGWTNGDTIITAPADEPISSIIARINDTRTPALVAIQDGTGKFGYTFLRIEPVPCSVNTMTPQEKP